MTYFEHHLENALVTVLDSHKAYKACVAKGMRFMAVVYANNASSAWKCARMWRARMHKDNSAHVETWRIYQTNGLGKGAQGHDELPTS